MLRSALFCIAIVVGATACGDDSGDTVPSVDAGAVDARPLELGGDRPVQVQAPAIEAGKTYPLMLVLHGFGANGLLQSAYLGVSPLVEDVGVIMLAPDGTVDAGGRRFWNASPACCDFGNTGVDDVAYLSKLLDDVLAAWPVDRSRVTVVGHSNGSYMAYRLACERADVITAIAGLAGATPSIDGSGCTPSKPVHVLHIHGTADDEVEYEGGTSGQVAVPGAEESVRQWRVHNGCAASGATAGTALDLERRLDGAETSVSVVDGCPAGGAVELWTIAGGSHRPTFQNSFGATMWAWLDAHRRP